VPHDNNELTFKGDHIWLLLLPHEGSLVRVLMGGATTTEAATVTLVVSGMTAGEVAMVGLGLGKSG
jgi:hypothetical protein